MKEALKEVVMIVMVVNVASVMEVEQYPV